MLKIGPQLQFSATGSLGLDAQWDPSIFFGFDKGGGNSDDFHTVKSTATVSFSGSAGFRIFGGMNAELELPGGLVGVSGEFGPELSGAVSHSCLTLTSSLEANLSIEAHAFAAHFNATIASGNFDASQVGKPICIHPGSTSGTGGGASGSEPSTPGTGSSAGPVGVAPSGATVQETEGGLGAPTFASYASVSGGGPAVPPRAVVAVSCKVYDPDIGSVSPDGYWYQLAGSPWNNQYYAAANTFLNGDPPNGPYSHNTDFAVPDCPGTNGPPSSSGSGGSGGGSGGQGSPPPGGTSAPTYAETTGSVAHTWTDYSDAGGTEGPEIGSNQTVQIACWAPGFKVADGNTYWYEIASSPWNDAYYVSADAFYNNGATSGTLSGTPFVDPAVPNCSGGGAAGGGSKPTYAETTGSVAHTWTDYSDAGGTEGPEIGSNQTVQIACWVSGFKVADGNTYWYEIASSPWNDAYYVSADAFYNNGATSGSLHGTPFVDPVVPQC